nr:putative mitochondrial protein [Tanacetum cinerariifolium]
MFCQEWTQVENFYRYLSPLSQVVFGTRILKRKGKVVVGNDLELRKELVQHFHDEAIGGHSGAHVTMKKLGSLFYWKGLSKVVTTPVKSNSVGQSSGYVTRNGVHKPYRLTQRELADKRAKGQCFFVTKNGDDETYQDCVDDMVGVTDSPHITLNALSGINFYHTMRVRGRVVFTSDVMLLPPGGCEMVLGIQWLATLGDMQCNFKKLIMKFNHKGRQLVLRGMNNTHVHWMQGNEGMLKQAELSSMALCVYPVQLCQMESVVSVSAEVDQVLT